MLNNFRNLQSLLGSHGSRWLLFRVAYALRRRTGLLRMEMPQYPWTDRPLATWLKKNIPATPRSYFEWRTSSHAPQFFFDPDTLPKDPSADPQLAVGEADRILSGELKYFAHTYHPIGFPPDWHKDPVTGVRLDSQKHWSELSDDLDVDIKFIWEPSRFGMVYPLVRAYGSTRDEKYAAAFWDLIQAWADSNPPNTGPNWMDGQEAALRLMAWTFGFYAFMDSPSTTAERLSQFTVMVAAHAERIYRNIAYAVSTYSNHTISEAFGLWLVGILFPELNDSEKYFDLGRRLLEQESVAQIFSDGSYSMYSLNYHRFILHLYLYAMRLGELNNQPFSKTMKARVTRSIDYLSQLIDPHTGLMPVYGSNDGALVLPLNNCDFTDYRPLLQLGSYITKRQPLFEPGPWDEDIFWLCGDRLLPSIPASLQKNSFPDGGTYILRGRNSKVSIRCTDYSSRPSHADQLHVDLWIHGKNIACDAGTYLYSGEDIWRNGLAHTSAHNTVTVDHRDQMKMLTRFTWTNWSHGKVSRHDQNIWQGEHDGYKRLSDPVHHRRTVLSLSEDRWLIVDHLTAQQAHHYTLHWLLNDFPFEQRSRSVILAVDSNRYSAQFGVREGNADLSIVRADPHSRRGWRSQYYGEKEPAISVMLETDQASVTFWSFFGFESDLIESVGNVLKINSQAIDLNK